MDIDNDCENDNTDDKGRRDIYSQIVFVRFAFQFPAKHSVFRLPVMASFQ